MLLHENFGMVTRASRAADSGGGGAGGAAAPWKNQEGQNYLFAPPPFHNLLTPLRPFQTVQKIVVHLRALQTSRSPRAPHPPARLSSPILIAPRALSDLPKISLGQQGLLRPPKNTFGASQDLFIVILNIVLGS